jgi:predicted DNA binding CopG/RHH family protein
MPRQLPKLNSDEDLEKAMKKDLSSYLDHQNLHHVTFEFAPKSKVMNLRISPELFFAIKKASLKRGIPYQRYVREALEESIKKTSGQ